MGLARKSTNNRFYCLLLWGALTASAACSHGDRIVSDGPGETAPTVNAEQEAQARAEREARIRSHNQEGFQALSEGRFSGALDAWHSSLELEPEQPRILSNLALLQARTGDLEAALEQAARAVQLEPTSPALSVNYGLLLEADDRGAEAVAHYRRALDLDATFKPAWLALGARALAAGDPVEAERHYSDALQHHPRSAEAMAGWASAAARMGR